MVDPPSKELLQTLFALKLCTPGDLRRCRRRVRRLARDVPAFDFVWIDALLYRKKITPFQARLLESRRSAELAVGPCVLIDRLGGGPTATTYLARHRDERFRRVLKCIDRPGDHRAASHSRLEELTHSAAGFKNSAIVAPSSCLIENERLIAISRHVAGRHLGELLVRRGRFPAAVVHDLARQLMDGLESFAKVGGPHGDVRLKNVRLTPKGVAVLVDAGVRPALSPVLHVDGSVSPDHYDGVAPELIGTGAFTNPRSDVYALGCLLWQLLAGRPPFLAGDPLAKLAAHQTQELPDVREIAPDTPANLANAIRSMTAVDPAARPQSCREVSGIRTRVGRRRTAAFQSAFNSAAPRLDAPEAASSRLRWTAMILLLAVTSGVALAMMDAGARGRLLSLSNTAAGWIENRGRRQIHDAKPVEADGGNSRDASTSGGDGPLALPVPDADGVIRLARGGRYTASRMTVVGRLTIRGEIGNGSVESVQPVIVVDDAPLHLVAEEVSIENVRFRRDDANGDAAVVGRPSSPFVLIEAQRFSLDRCRFDSRPDSGGGEERGATQRNVSPAAAVGWKPVDDGDRTGRRIVIRDCVFQNDGSSIYLAASPERLQASNTLKTGSGAFIVYSPSAAERSGLRADFERLTLRQASALVRLQIAQPDQPLRVELEAVDCVFDLTTDNSAIFQILGDRISRKLTSGLSLVGEGVLVRPETTIAAVVHNAGSTSTPLPPDAVVVEGLFATAFKFRGSSSGKPADSTVTEYSAPVRTPEPPGIDAGRLPE